MIKDDPQQACIDARGSASASARIQGSVLGLEDAGTAAPTVAAAVVDSEPEAFPNLPEDNAITL